MGLLIGSMKMANNRRRLFSLAAVILGFAGSNAGAQPAQNTVPLIVTVTRVLDGDTFIASGPDNQTITVRIASIDAPEKSQPGGDESRQSLRELILKKTVLLSATKTDVFKRTVANVHIEDGNVDVSEAQIRAGMAWVFERYIKEQATDKREIYRNAQQLARAERLGIWKDIDNALPVPPWQFRRGNIN